MELINRIRTLYEYYFTDKYSVFKDDTGTFVLMKEKSLAIDRVNLEASYAEIQDKLFNENMDAIFTAEIVCYFNSLENTEKKELSQNLVKVLEIKYPNYTYLPPQVLSSKLYSVVIHDEPVGNIEGTENCIHKILLYYFDNKKGFIRFNIFSKYNLNAPDENYKTYHKIYYYFSSLYI